jgi:hypothetical protein
LAPGRTVPPEGGSKVSTWAGGGRWENAGMARAGVDDVATVRLREALAGFLRRCLVATTADGGQIRYLARDDLITMRRAAGRAKDLRRAAELEQLRAASSARDSPRIRVANPVDPSLSSD